MPQEPKARDELFKEIFGSDDALGLWARFKLSILKKNGKSDKQIAAYLSGEHEVYCLTKLGQGYAKKRRLSDDSPNISPLEPPDIVVLHDMVESERSTKETQWMDIWEKMSEEYRKIVLDAAEAEKYQWKGTEGEKLRRMLNEMNEKAKQVD